MLVLDELAERTPQPPRLLTADEVAAYLAVDVDFVYDHAGEPGAIRLGDGPRARLRLRVERVDEWLASCPGGRKSGRTVERKRQCRPPRSGSDAPLLPDRGHKAGP